MPYPGRGALVDTEAVEGARRWRRWPLSGSRGASGVEYALVISLLLAGSLASIESMDKRIEDNYESTANDIGQMDLDTFSVPTVAEALAAESTPEVPVAGSGQFSSPVAPSIPLLEHDAGTVSSTSGDMQFDGTGWGVPNGFGGNGKGAHGTSSSLTFDFTVTEAGVYRIEGEILSPSGKDNSFWVTVDGEPKKGFEWRQGVHTTYTWEFVNDGAGTPAVEVPLDPGAHQIVVSLREDGTYIDGLRLVAQ